MLAICRWDATLFLRISTQRPLLHTVQGQIYIARMYPGFIDACLLHSLVHETLTQSTTPKLYMSTCTAPDQVLSVHPAAGCSQPHSAACKPQQHVCRTMPQEAYETQPQRSSGSEHRQASAFGKLANMRGTRQRPPSRCSAFP